MHSVFFHRDTRALHRVLRPRPATSNMSTLGVPRKFDSIPPQHLLEPPADLHQCLPSLISGSPGNSWAWSDHSTSSSSPDTYPVIPFADINHNTHYLRIPFLLQRFSDGGKHDMEPKFVDWYVRLTLKLIGPFPTSLILWIFPLWSDSIFEEMIIRPNSEVRCLRDVVL